MVEVLTAGVALLGAAVLGISWLWWHGFFDRGLPGYRRKDHRLIEEAGDIGRPSRRKRR